jgi:hypothetical protein
VAAALSAVCFGAVGVAVRALLGPTVPGLVVYTLTGCALYALLLWRFRERLEVVALRGLLDRRGGAQQAPVQA